MITYTPWVSCSLLIEWTHMLDEDRRDRLVSFNKNNNAKISLFLTFILNQQFRNNNHWSYAWKDENELPPFSLVSPI